MIDACDLPLWSFGIAAVLLCHGPLETTAAGQDGLFMNSEATAPIPAGLPAVRGRSFVPLHSTVIAGGGATRLNFSGSLSIHNTSAKHVLIIDAIEYRDASGRLVENYARGKIGLRPFASIQAPIAQEDTRGASGSPAPGAVRSIRGGRRASALRASCGPMRPTSSGRSTRARLSAPSAAYISRSRRRSRGSSAMGLAGAARRSPRKVLDATPA